MLTELPLNALELLTIITAPAYLFLSVLHARHWYLTKKQDLLQLKLDDTYSKKETKELVNLHLDPIKSSLDLLIRSLDKNTDMVQKLQIKLAVRASDLKGKDDN